MALDDIGRLRLYLRDQKEPFVFTVADLEQLISETASIEEATAMGWLLKAGQASDTPRTMTIGQVSETLGQATESYKQAMSMYQLWSRKAGVPLIGTAQWFEMQPDEGQVADIMDTVAIINQYWRDNDISRLDPVIYG